MTATPASAYAALLAEGALHPDPSQAQAAAKLESLHQNLDRSAENTNPLRRHARRFGIPGFRRRRQPVKGLYLWGGVGRGKSMLMDMFFSTAPLQKKRRIHFHEFMQDVHARIFARRKQAPDAGDPIPPVARAIAAQTRLLCLDEFQVANIADASILSRLFSTLLDAEQVIVATSNRAPEQLYEGGLHRDRFLPFIELLQHRLEILHLDGGADYRLGRLQGQQKFFTPLGRTASQALDAAFLRLADNRSGAPMTINIDPHGKRMLQVPCASMGVARFSFANLCGQPLGAADYLTLARNFHTLLLDDVPLLSPQQHNQAARFTILIDTLYEARTRLLFSAAAPPDALFTEGRGSFAFQRTASRLQEMLSADYDLQ